MDPPTANAAAVPDASGTAITYAKDRMRRTLPWLAVAAVLAGTAYGLRSQGRLWACSCDYILLWSGDAWSSDNSQHLLDPYSFTHVLHGFAFCGLLALVVPRLPAAWRLWLAVSIEASWEVVENSEFVIRRYREETAALGYNGDSVLNSLSDIAMMGIGFLAAGRLPIWAAVALVAVLEIVPLIIIRDNLTLNVWMLLWPTERVAVWQAGA